MKFFGPLNLWNFLWDSSSKTVGSLWFVFHFITSLMLVKESRESFYESYSSKVFQKLRFAFLTHFITFILWEEKHSFHFIGIKLNVRASILKVTLIVLSSLWRMIIYECSILICGYLFSRSCNSHRGLIDVDMFHLLAIVLK